MSRRIFIPLLAVVFLAFASCKKHKLKSSSSDFSAIYNQLISDGNDADYTWDAEVHAYSFVLSSDKTVQSFGYQSYADLSNTEYVIEIMNLDDSTVVYSDGHIFDDNDISYATPTTAITLQSGVNYSISRIQTNWIQYITEVVGHIVRTEDSDYPITAGDMTITSSQFYDFGSTSFGWTTNAALPRIDLVFN